MNPTKRMSILFLTICCACSLIVPAFSSEIAPMAEGTKLFQATLSIGANGQASCSVTARASLITHNIEVSMKLEQLDNPSPLKLWTASGIGKLSMSETYYVYKGYDYRVIATIMVKDAAGTPIESFTTQSSVVHY